MNKTLTIQSDAVQKYGGMVDKYIGDAMMAIFSAPLDLEDHETRAVMAAQAIVERMKEADLGIKIGIGINSGYAILGNLGSTTRFDYTAIGDAVNVAARLESSTKEVGVGLLIGETTAAKCSIETTFKKDIFVKGKELPLKVFVLKP